jgi:hypothetical protein
LVASSGSPALFARLVFGAELSGAGVALGRLAGMAMLAVGVMSWPTPEVASSQPRIVCALLTYNLLTTTYLAHFGIAGGTTGIMLWPAVAIHAIFALLFACSLITWRSATES